MFLNQHEADASWVCVRLGPMDFCQVNTGSSCFRKSETIDDPGFVGRNIANTEVAERFAEIWQQDLFGITLDDQAVEIDFGDEQRRTTAKHLVVVCAAAGVS